MMVDSSYPLSAEDAAYILEEDPFELHEMIKENEPLLLRKAQTLMAQGSDAPKNA